MDHWAHQALGRLEGLGLLPAGHDPGSRSLTVEEALRRFEEAEARSPSQFEPLARGYREWLEGEVGRRGPGDDSRRLYARTLAGFGHESGRLEPGTSGYDLIADWTGPRERPDASGVRLRASVSAGLAPWLAAGTAVRGLGSTFAVEEAYALAAASPLGVWLGRRSTGFRPIAAGGVPLDSVRVDGGGLLLLRPVAIPVVGPLGFETTLSRISDNGRIGAPWLWTARLSLEPHARWGIGVSRAAMFGGDRNEPITLRNMLYMLVGKHGGSGSGFENQVAAVDLRFRPPLPAPVELALEWGFDDSAGAWYDQPAMTASAELAAVPGLPEVALGVEYARISGQEEGHSLWYRHWWFHDGWVSNGSSLGHPLGGHGEEWRLYGSADAVGAGLRMATTLFVRERGEFNLFAPDREGRSQGLDLRVDWRLAPHVELIGSAVWEEGDTNWRQVSATLGAQWLPARGTP